MRYSIPVIVKNVSLGFLSGVLLHALSPLAPMSIWIPFLVLCLSLLPRQKIFLLAAIAFTIGFFRFEATLPGQLDALSIYTGSVTTIEGRVKSLRPYDAVLDVYGSASDLSFQKGKRFMAVGERIALTCRIERNEKSDPRYTLWDARKGIFYTCKGSVSFHTLARPSPFDVFALLSIWRDVISTRINRAFPGDTGALLAGILYGERSLSKQANEEFRIAGMTHLIAVSGSNITLVVSLFVPFFIALGYRRKMAIFLSGFGILLFTIFVGAEASVVRAALMGWLALNARSVGRKANGNHLLLLAATIMTMFDPWALAYDAGFALSFLATWGLLVGSKPLERYLTFIPDVFGLREIVSTTTAATIVTIPYLLWAFEVTSLAGLLTNIFAIPLVGFAMAFGVIAVCFFGFIPLIELPAQGALMLMLFIAKASTLAPWLQFSFILPTWGLYLSYGVLILLWKLYEAKKQGFPQAEWEIRDFEGFSKAFVRPF